MFFRPTFCANCGEKIERTDWGVFTSRRFCQVCESEFKGLDMVPRLVVFAGVAIGILGLGGYLRSGTSAGSATAARLARPPVEQSLTAQTIPQRAAVESRENAYSNSALIQEPRPRQLASNTVRTAVPDITASEDVYFCGARTKKGTPCSRKVKGNVRCFQHTGMPAMLSAEQLKIK